MEDAVVTIRQVPIPMYHLSQRDIEIALGFDLATLGNPPEIDAIRRLNEALSAEYGSDEHRTLQCRIERFCAKLHSPFVAKAGIPVEIDSAMTLPITWS